MQNAQAFVSRDRTVNAVCVDEGVVRFPKSFTLESGNSLETLRVGMRIAGAPGKPVVVAMGGISASRKAVATADEDADGWWQNVLGDDGAGILARYRVLGFDYLGGAGDTTSPANWPGADAEFPEVDTLDQARLLALLLDHLEIPRLDAILSASYGGMVALHFADRFPERVGRVLVIGSAHRPEPMAVARRYVQKRILALGSSGGSAAEAVAIARALAMTTYRSAREFRERFSGAEGQESLQSYLDYQGRKFARRFGCESYLRLMDSIDRHVMDPSGIRVPLTLVGFDTDELCPPSLLRELAELPQADTKLIELDSVYGHDAFLCEAQQVAVVVQDFLQEKGHEEP